MLFLFHTKCCVNNVINSCESTRLGHSKLLRWLGACALLAVMVTHPDHFTLVKFPWITLAWFWQFKNMFQTLKTPSNCYAAEKDRKFQVQCWFQLCRPVDLHSSGWHQHFHFFRDKTLFATDSHNDLCIFSFIWSFSMSHVLEGEGIPHCP